MDYYDCEPDYDVYEKDREWIALEERLDDTSLCVKEIVEMLYSTREIDIGKLDDAMARLCDNVHLDVPDGAPLVRRVRSELFNFAVDVSKNVI